MKNMLMCGSRICAIAAVLATNASANLLIDFDDSVNPFSNGTVSSDFSNSGANSLYLGNRVTATYELPSEYQGKDVTITMKVLDLGLFIDREVTGRPTNAYGPRWGVGTSTANTGFLAATIIEKTFLPSTAGFGHHATSAGDSFTSTSWFSPAFYSGATRAVLSDDGGSNTGTWAPGTPADSPVWMDWTFTFNAAGDVSYNLAGSPSLTGNVGVGNMSIMLYGGNDGSSSLNALTGLYIDDISIVTVVPEAETFSMLLGVFSLGLFLVRRRR